MRKELFLIPLFFLIFFAMEIARHRKHMPTFSELFVHAWKERKAIAEAGRYYGFIALLVGMTFLALFFLTPYIMIFFSLE